MTVDVVRAGVTPSRAACIPEMGRRKEQVVTESGKNRAAALEAAGALEKLSEKMNVIGDEVVSLVSQGRTVEATEVIDTKLEPIACGSMPLEVDSQAKMHEKELALDAANISRTTNVTTWGLWIAAFIILAVGLGSPLLLSRMIVKPVIDLKEAAEKFGAGDLDVQVDIHSNDELGSLGSTFNKTVADRKRAEEALKKARDELEARVDERTADLNAANQTLQAEIEERRLTQQMLSRANDELESINRELNEFAYVVSHDLKAPLRGISSLATWLGTDYADKLDEDGKKQLDLLRERTKRMEALIDSILKYSRIGRVSEERGAIDTGALVAEAIDMLAPPDNIQITVEGDLPVVCGERTRISQVFGNLLSNAVKFMDKPGGEITVACTGDADYWRFSVSDNGPGIDEKYFDKVFKLFQMLSPEASQESTGIGLTLVKKIVEMHGGRVWVESDPGTGATFFFTFPK